MDVTSTAATAPTAGRALPFEFRATGAQYFRIWIVNLLLTILTLGIYSAWAKVRRLRYLYGSTSVSGSSFEYHGQPLQILKGRLIAVGVFVIYGVVTRYWPVTTLLFLPLLMLVFPLVIVLSRRFQMRMTSWRNIRFGFHGEYGGALAAYVGWGVVAVATLYLLLPLWLHKRVGFLVNHTSLGTSPMKLAATVGRFFGIYYATMGLGLAAFFALASVMGGMIAGLAGPAGGQPSPAALGGVGVAMTLGILVVPLALGAFWERAFTNAVYDGVTIGPHRVNCRIRFGRLLWLYGTNVLGVLLTLGLFYPWALVRRIRYQFECMGVDVEGSLDDFAAAAAPEASATGEAIGEVFDVDFGI